MMRSALRDAALRVSGEPWKKAAAEGADERRPEGLAGDPGLHAHCRRVPVVQLSDVLKPRNGEPAFTQTATKVLLVIPVWKEKPRAGPQPQGRGLPLWLVPGSILQGSGGLGPF